ncbi:MAG: phosphoribosylformylglycinamidine cyclo-ligase, partial [Nitrospirae bacterium]|nr:phosphoribosylformylglycinamidine cyclo-ligase [Nitrospirota bacterium]
GFIIVVKESDLEDAMKKLQRFGEEAFVIGYVERGKGGVVYA